LFVLFVLFVDNCFL